MSNGKGQPILECHKNIIPIHIPIGVYMEILSS